MTDYAGGGANKPYPNGVNSSDMSDFLVSVYAFMDVRPGTCTIAFCSDEDGMLARERGWLGLSAANPQLFRWGSSTKAALRCLSTPATTESKPDEAVVTSRAVGLPTALSDLWLGATNVRATLRCLQPLEFAVTIINQGVDQAES